MTTFGFSKKNCALIRRYGWILRITPVLWIKARDCMKSGVNLVLQLQNKFLSKNQQTKSWCQLFILLFIGRSIEWKRSSIIHQDNTPIHESVLTMTKFNELKYELFDHTMYAPDVILSDLYLFQHPKYNGWKRTSVLLKNHHSDAFQWNGGTLELMYYAGIINNEKYNNLPINNMNIWSILKWICSCYLESTRLVNLW